MFRNSKSNESASNKGSRNPLLKKDRYAPQQCHSIRRRIGLKEGPGRRGVLGNAVTPVAQLVQNEFDLHPDGVDGQQTSGRHAKGGNVGFAERAVFPVRWPQYGHGAKEKHGDATEEADFLLLLLLLLQSQLLGRTSASTTTRMIVVLIVIVMVRMRVSHVHEQLRGLSSSLLLLLL